MVIAVIAPAAGDQLWRRRDDSLSSSLLPSFPSPFLLPPPSFISNRRRRRRRAGARIRCQRKDNRSWQSHGMYVCMDTGDDAREEGMKARIRKREKMWHQFFADPSQWWDNRLTKKNLKQPDFRHKRTLEGLWIGDSPWLKERIATLDWHSNPSSSNDDQHKMTQKLCKQGRLEDAIHLVELMVQQTPMEDNAPKATYISLLKECAKRKMLREGKRVHSLIVQSKCDSDIFLANNLIDMYSKCGSLQDACLVFNAMSLRNLFSWTAIISAYADSGKCEEAINLYKKMQNIGISPDKVVLIIVLKACARIAALETGKQIHSLILEKGFHLDIIVQNTLVDVYAKCGCLDESRELFSKMSERNVVSWNAMIAGYVQNGLGTEAIALYEQMKQEGMEADRVTFLCVLKACANIGALEQGKQIHSLILETGIHLDMILQSTLVDMYAKCGCLNEARELFDEMSERDVVSWNAMIAGYAQNGLATEAIALYEQMKQEGLEADRVSFLCVLKACANIGALEQGKQIHSLILEKGFHLDMNVQNTLVDMYAKCGCLDTARELFNKMGERDVVSWNAMIAGYAQNGLGTDAIALYGQMKKEGIQSDDFTFTCVLSACSHSGLVKEGFHVFDFLCRYSGVIPTLDHYACMIDLLGRAGLLVEAKDFIVKLPIQPNSVVWRSLLGAARNVGNAEIGQFAFNNLVKLDPQNVTSYVLLIDIFVRVGQMDKVAEINRQMTDKDLKKMPGCSWIEVDNQVHSFVVGDESHPQSQQIWAEMTRLLGLMRKAGYVLEDVSGEGKEITFCKHSEMLAIAFGLTSIPPMIPIRIKKNLPMCHDCHNATKIISKIIGEEIYVMDANRLHHFEDGFCSCRDYW